MLTLAKYSLGVGDRFAHQAKAQLRACMLAAERGAEVVPVWNKSHREHTTIGSEPDSVRTAADAAVRELGWKKPYHVDADHIRLETVDGFLASSDFYTIDVADAIGRPAAGGRRDGLRRPPSRSRRSFANPWHRGAVPDDAGRRGADRRQVPACRAGGGADLPTYRRGQGRRDVHHRSVDGRDRQPADAARAAGHPGRRRRREDPHSDDRAEVHRPFQQGRRLRRRPGAVREGIQRRPRRDRLRGQAIRPAREPETQRPFRQRQVFHLRADPPGRRPLRRRRCTSRRPARPGWKR